MRTACKHTPIQPSSMTWPTDIVICEDNQTYGRSHCSNYGSELAGHRKNCIGRTCRASPRRKSSGFGRLPAQLDSICKHRSSSNSDCVLSGKSPLEQWRTLASGGGFSNVDLEIQGRSASFEVVELPDELPNVVGQTPLEILDWVVDTRSRKLIPNPAHPHGEMCDDF